MKKHFYLLLALVLLLTGCANADADQTQGTMPQETQPSGYYVANSAVETQTNGAVRLYELPDSSYRWIKTMGDSLLLATDADSAQLSVLSGDTCIPVANAQTESINLGHCEALFNGFAYYDVSSVSAQYLDMQLNEMHGIALPEEMTSGPIFSPDGSRIFYSIGNEIRAIDVTRNLSRLVKTQNVEKQTLIGTCFGGKVLICNVEDSEGKVNTLYISSENGQTLRTENNIRSLCTYEDRYIAERMDGTVLQRIVGTYGGEAKQLNIIDPNWAGALELGGVVGYSINDSGLLLNYYDITSGKKTASVTLAEIGDLTTILADRWSGCIWILSSGATNDETLLLRWDIKASSVQEDESYIGTLYTVENPDSASLDALNDRISALNKKYGVRIRIWKDAVKSPGNHTLAVEHQVSAITDMLDKLEPVLAEFPKSFVSKSISSKVRICLVRSVDGQSKGVQYWQGSNAFIALSIGIDVRSEFLKAFGSVIDSHVLGNSPKYDYWDTLNPSGFMYGGDADESLATGENRAFADIESMSSGTIDRSRVFWQAMLPENADMFKSETMQKKLTMLCKAIRDAWNLEKSTDIFPWEQYLTKPIAKIK